MQFLTLSRLVRASLLASVILASPPARAVMVCARSIKRALSSDL